MDAAYSQTIHKVLTTFGVDPANGLSEDLVAKQRAKHGKNCMFRLREPLPPVLLASRSANSSLAIPEEPPTPLWELILEQFKDQLVLILLGSAAISFGLALFEDEDGWSAFVDPAVVCPPLNMRSLPCVGWSESLIIPPLADPHHPHPQRRCRCLAREQR